MLTTPFLVQLLSIIIIIIVIIIVIVLKSSFEFLSILCYSGRLSQVCFPFKNCTSLESIVESLELSKLCLPRVFLSPAVFIL